MCFGAILKTIYNAKTEMLKNGRCLMLIDEIQRLGNFQELHGTALAAARGYGVILWAIAQSSKGFETAAGQGAFSDWIANAQITQFFAVGDKDTADYVSAMAGDGTIIGSKLTEHGDKSAHSTELLGQISAEKGDATLQGRKLLLPSDVTQLPLWQQICFVKGQPVMKCGRSTWFLRNEFKGLIDPVKMPASEDGIEYRRLRKPPEAETSFSLAAFMEAALAEVAPVQGQEATEVEREAARGDDLLRSVGLEPHQAPREAKGARREIEALLERQATRAPAKAVPAYPDQDWLPPGVPPADDIDEADFDFGGPPPLTDDEPTPAEKMTSSQARERLRRMAELTSKLRGKDGE
jgi:hypothetical protein